MASIFPQGTAVISNNLIEKKSNIAYGKSYLFDFDTGEFVKRDGKVVVAEGIEVLKNWIEKTLRTERYRYPIYSFNYGSELESLRSKYLSHSQLGNELKRRISEALTQDERIAAVDEFGFSRSGSTLTVSFKVTTFDDSVAEMEVRYDV